MLPRIPYPVTEYAVVAIEEGLERVGKSQADLARELDVTPQAVNRILRLREKSGNCEFLADALRAVGEPEFLALPGLNEGEQLIVRHLHGFTAGGVHPAVIAKLMDIWLHVQAELKPQEADDLLAEIERLADREIAYRTKP